MCSKISICTAEHLVCVVLHVVPRQECDDFIGQSQNYYVRQVDREESILFSRVQVSICTKIQCRNTALLILLVSNLCMISIMLFAPISCI